MNSSRRYCVCHDLPRSGQSPQGTALREMADANNAPHECGTSSLRVSWDISLRIRIARPADGLVPWLGAGYRRWVERYRSNRGEGNLVGNSKLSVKLQCGKFDQRGRHRTGTYKMAGATNAARCCAMVIMPCCGMAITRIAILHCQHGHVMARTMNPHGDRRGQRATRRQWKPQQQEYHNEFFGNIGHKYQNYIYINSTGMSIK